MISLSQSFALAAQAPLAAPQEEADAEQHHQAESEHEGLNQPVAFERKRKPALRARRTPPQRHQQRSQPYIVQTARGWAFNHAVKLPFRKLSDVRSVSGKLT